MAMTRANVPPMLRRSFRKGLSLGLLAGVAYAVSKVLQRRDDDRLVADAPAPTWSPLAGTTPLTAPPAEPSAHAPVQKVEQAVAKKQPAPKKAPARKPAPLTPWVDPVDGVCPTTHPVKAKLS